MIGRGFVYEQGDLPKREDEHGNEPESSKLAQRLGLHGEMMIYQGFEGNNTNRTIRAEYRRQGSVLSYYASILSGSSRTRRPVAANTAFAIAGAIGGVPASPIPPGVSAPSMMCTSISGASDMRAIR